jgi:aldose sugar dehydrogenase
MIYRIAVGLFVIVTLLTTSSPLQAQVDEAAPIFRDGDVAYTIEIYTYANYPVALAFAPDGRLFYTEKNTGNVRVIDASGQLQPEPVITLPTSGLVERGMLGIALDPDYDDNGYIWIVHIREATARDFAAYNIVRFREEDGTGHDPEVMFNFPLTNNPLIHLGGNLYFDDNGLLFFSMGDNEIPANAQDIDTIPGGIHRAAVTEDGLIPAPGNPFEDSTLYAYGLRNPFDFVIDPYSDGRRLFATDNGDQCDDKVNMILPGFNYGMGPGYVCGGTAAGIDMAFYQPPMLRYTPSEAPTGILVYDHDAVPQWQGDVFFCAWNSGLLRRVELNQRRNQAAAVHELDLGDAQCRIDIAIGPEGGLYFTMVGAEGGIIYRLLPVDMD